MIQDSDGFIWFGTEYGLNKYNGYNIEIFTPEEGRKGSLTGNEVWSLMEDSHRWIWAGTNKGVNIFDKESYSFRKLEAETKEGKKIDGTVSYILEVENGDIWFGTFTDGIFKLENETNDLTHYPITEYTPESPEMAFRIWSMIIDKNNTLWAATWSHGLLKLNTKTGEFEFLTVNNSNLKDNRLGNLFPFSDTEIWIGTLRSGMQVLDIETHEISFTGSKKLDEIELIHDIIRDMENRYWVSSYGNGIFLFDKDLNQIDHLHHEENNSQSLSGDLALTLIQDSSGCIWAGTWAGGVNKYCKDAIKFTCCQNQYSTENVFGIEGDHKNLLIGTYGDGLFIIDEQKNKIENIRYNPDNPEGLPGNLILSMDYAGDGIYWIGYDGRGFSKFDINKRSFQNYIKKEESADGLRFDIVKKILVSKDDRIWLGTSGGGVSLFEPEKETYRHFNTVSSPSISSNTITAIFEDRYGNIWVGTRGGGLNKIGSLFQSVQVFSSQPNSSNTLSSNDIWDIWEDRNGLIWAATSMGLNSLNPETGEIEIYTEQDGLGNNWIYTIQEDEEGRLWLSTNGGLTVFDPGKKTFMNYDVNDGLQSNEFNANAKHKRSDEKMYFGGIKGFNAFYPDEISSNTKESNIVLTGLEVLNKPIAVGEKHPDVYTTPKHISQLENLVGLYPLCSVYYSHHFFRGADNHCPGTFKKQPEARTYGFTKSPGTGPNQIPVFCRYISRIPDTPYPHFCTD